MSSTPPPAPSHPPPPKPKKHHAKPPPRPPPPPPHYPEGHGAEQSAPPPHHRNQPHHEQHPPANVTIVRTAEELQQATLRGAIDIEIRDHIDLSTLNLAFDPTGEFKGTVRMYGKSSLLYSYSPMRSIRGNCSEPDAARALQLADDDAAVLLPLKPFQCLLRTHEPLLTVNNGKVWLDNVYLLLRRSVVRPRMAFISAGTARQDEADPPGIRSSDVYATNVTFHGEPRGCMRAYFSDVGSARSFFGDCVFTEWSGQESPISAYLSAVVNIVNSVFRNMWLAVEIADVSYGSTARFQNVLFANVTLDRGRVVSTTTNDYDYSSFDGLEYYATDDAAYDVDVAKVPPEERGVWGADYVIEDDLLSDCMYMGVPFNYTMPGCPEQTQESKRRMFERTHFVEYTGGEIDDMYSASGYWWSSPPNVYERLIDENTPWFVATKKILPQRLSTPPDWPDLADAQPAAGAASSSLGGAVSATAGLPLVPALTTRALAAGALLLPPGIGCNSTDVGRAHACAEIGGSGSGSSGPHWSLWIVLALVAVALGATVAALAALCKLRRRQTQKQAYIAAGASSGASRGVDSVEGSSQLLLLSGGSGSGRDHSQSIELVEAAAHPHEARLRKLARQLDRFGPRDILLGRFELLGPRERLEGGSTMVQFARGTLDHKEYAIKFFLDTDAFEAEATLLAAHMPALRSSLAWPLAARSAAVAADAVATASAAGASAAARASRHGADVSEQFLPLVAAISDGTAAALEDPKGHGLPPCVVTARGESLLEWSIRAAPDQFSSMAILSSVSLRLANLHAAGYVHRNVKPTNIVLMPRAKRWVLVSFSRTARMGGLAPLYSTLAYAPPEAVQAYERGEREIRCVPELDSWALGVLAFELLRGTPAFDMAAEGQAKVLAMLRGDELLPWEGERGTESLASLGALKGQVLQLLQRDPGQRASVRRFHLACSRVFASHVTIPTSGAGFRAAQAAPPSGPDMVSAARGQDGDGDSVWIGDGGDGGVPAAFDVTEDSTCTSTGL